ncbi:MAG TPA: hypothetical protein PKC83_17885 [Gemmatimonadaceae bacterium]|nr:hypothetical protein [Gemmatimonadaceae bacterium]
MSAAARSVRVFGAYISIVGITLMLAPNVLLGLFGMPSTTEPWIRVLGVVLIALGAYYLLAAREEWVAFLRMTVWLRYFAAASLIGLAVLQMAPAALALFGVVDGASALWTHLALRGARQVAMEGA